MRWQGVIAFRGNNVPADIQGKLVVCTNVQQLSEISGPDKVVAVLAEAEYEAIRKLPPTVIGVLTTGNGVTIRGQRVPQKRTHKLTLPTHLTVIILPAGVRAHLKSHGVMEIQLSKHGAAHLTWHAFGHLPVSEPMASEEEVEPVAVQAKYADA
jgi:hypothetical protein